MGQPFEKNNMANPTISYVRVFAVEWFLLLAGLLLFASFIAYTLIKDYDAVAQREQTQLATQVKIIENTLTAHLSSIRNAHLNVRSELLEGQRLQEDRSLFVRKRLQGFSESIASVATMLVLDKQGTVLETTDPGVIGKNFSQREYFQKPLRHPDLNTLYISPPFKASKSGWTIAVASMLPDLAGEFNGAVVTVLNPKTLVQLLNSVLYVADAQASIAYGDGALFLATTEHPVEQQNELSQPDAFYAKHLITGQPLSLQVVSLPSKNTQRLAAFHTINSSLLHADMALLVSISRDQQVLYNSWHKHAAIDAGLFSALALTSIPGLLLLQRRRYLARISALAVEQVLREKNLALQHANQALQANSKHLRSLAFLDGLTQIPNRRRFDHELNVLWQRYTRDHLPLSVLMIDLDFFKEYNDHYGHQEGDQCLKTIATTLYQSLSRTQDLVARYGGEEFVCLLPNTDPAGAAVVAEKLRAAVEALAITHSHSSTSAYVTISIGVATAVPLLDTEAHAIIEAADKALYAAKQSGRNRFHCAEHA